MKQDEILNTKCTLNCAFRIVASFNRLQEHMHVIQIMSSRQIGLHGQTRPCLREQKSNSNNDSSKVRMFGLLSNS